MGHKEEQQAKKVEANQIRIEKELQKEDALRRKVDTDGTKVASSGTDPENQSGFVDGFISKRVTSMSTSRVAETIWKLLRVFGLRLQIYEGLATSEGGLVLSMEGQSREAINATNILNKDGDNWGVTSCAASEKGKIACSSTDSVCDFFVADSAIQPHEWCSGLVDSEVGTSIGDHCLGNGC
ncbi:hypothetical protein Tco_1348407 [Tanacetum coccineum]